MNNKFIKEDIFSKFYIYLFPLILMIFLNFLYPEPQRILDRLLSILKLQEIHPSYHSIYIREKFINISLKAFMKHSLGGIGLGKFISLPPPFFRSPHNDYLWVLIEGGLFVFIPFIFILIRFAKKSYRMMKLTRYSPNR